LHQIRERKQTIDNRKEKKEVLSDKAKEKLRMTREVIERSSKYVKLDIGQKRPIYIRPRENLRAYTWNS
jgi:hypothetical protein